MLKWIDDILDRTTMYRLLLYFLIFMLVVAAIFGAVGLMPYSPLAILYSSAVLLAVCWVSNKIFAMILRVPVNGESSLITALILALIISPPFTATKPEYFGILPFLFLAGSAAMASKYIINIGKKHLFNPAAFAVVLTSYAIGQSASWWIGSAPLTVFVIIFGLLMIRKLRQFDLAVGFYAAFIIEMLATKWGSPNLLNIFWTSLVSSPLVFFSAVMLTEPLTMPPDRDRRVAYGILTGALFFPGAHLGSLHFEPESALLVGNLFSYLVSPKGRHVFTLKEIKQAADGVYDFVLQPDRKFSFRPGQYMEWTLGFPKADSRGNRRYLTLASSPTEDQALLGVKFYEKPSTFKKHLIGLKPGAKIVGGQLAGEFVLPKDPNEKLVLLAGGIGVTPFRSMVKYLLDKNEKRDIILIYANRHVDEVAYWRLFETASDQIGLKTVYVLSDRGRIPQNWDGHIGHVDEHVIAKEVPDFMDRTFYISGSHTMVEGSRHTLRKMGLPRSRIKTDFFPGLT